MRTKTSSTPPYAQALLNRRYQVQGSSTGEVTVFVFDLVQVSSGRTVLKRWRTSFMPETGDVLEQVARRMKQ